MNKFNRVISQEKCFCIEIFWKPMLSDDAAAVFCMMMIGEILK